MQYLELAGSLHQYGFMHLDNLQLDHPKDDIIGKRSSDMYPHL